MESKKIVIAILYKDGNLISKEKKIVKDYLAENLIDSNIKNVYKTEELEIHWVNIEKRNLNKFYKNNDVSKTISILNKNQYFSKELISFIEENLNQVEIFFIEDNLSSCSRDKEIRFNIEKKIISNLEFSKKKSLLNSYYFLSEEDALKSLIDKVKRNIERKKDSLNYHKEEIEKIEKEIMISKDFLNYYKNI